MLTDKRSIACIYAQAWDKQLKAILHYALGLRFGNLKRSKTQEKTQPTRVFTQRIV